MGGADHAHEHHDESCGEREEGHHGEAFLEHAFGTCGEDSLDGLGIERRAQTEKNDIAEPPSRFGSGRGEDLLPIEIVSVLEQFGGLSDRSVAVQDKVDKGRESEHEDESLKNIRTSNCAKATESFIDENDGSKERDPCDEGGLGW